MQCFKLLFLSLERPVSENKAGLCLVLRIFSEANYRMRPSNRFKKLESINLSDKRRNKSTANPQGFKN